MLLIVSHELAGPVTASSHVNLAWNAVAPSNMRACASVSAAVPVHEEMSWLNAEAKKNIPPISVTCDVSQLPMSWLNAKAKTNIPVILVTFPVSQLPMSWLNAEAE